MSKLQRIQDAIKVELAKPVEDCSSELLNDLTDQLLAETKGSVSDAEKMDFSSGIKQWGVNGRNFMPMGQSVGKLPAGWYIARSSMQGPYVQAKDTKDEKLMNLPNPVYGAVLDDIRKFWGNAESYKKYGFPYKRGIIIFGNPGQGKTGLINLIGEELISKHDGLLFDIQDPHEIDDFVQAYQLVREQDPKRPMVVVMEDIDNFARYGGSVYAKLLNVLDGNMNISNVVFLATTNHISALQDNLVQRPSRFDRRYELKSPSPEARKFYVEKKFPEMKPETVNEIVSNTDGFTLDQLKELVLSTQVLGYPMQEAIAEMGGQFKRTDDLNYSLGDSAPEESVPSEKVQELTGLLKQVQDKVATLKPSTKVSQKEK